MLYRMRWLAFLVLAATAAPLWSVRAEAEQVTSDLDALERELRSGNEARMVRALQSVARSPTREAAPLVEGVLQRGASEPVCLAAFQALAAIGAASSSTVLAPYVRHRAAQVRRQATRALIQTKGPAAVTALRQGLRSRDAALRDVAARGLAALDAKEAVGDLILAFDRGMNTAGVAAAKICDPQSCAQLIRRIGKVPFERIRAPLEVLLLRPAAEVAPEQKLAIVAALMDLEDKRIRDLASSVLQAWPSDGNDEVRKALTVLRDR